MQNLCTYTVGVLEHGIGEDVARVDVFSGDHAEDVEVLGTVCQWQFYLHAVVIGVGGGHMERYFLDTRTGRTVNP